MDCVTVKEQGWKNVIFITMFHCAYTKSFAGHYNNAMFVVMSITFGSYIWVYIKEKLFNESLYNTSDFDTPNLWGDMFMWGAS